VKNAYQGLLLEEPIFIHPSSVLFKKLPQYICYTEIVETSKIYMKGVCSIEETWLPLFLSSQCSFDKPIVEEDDDNDVDGDDKSKIPPPRFDPLKGVVVCHCSSKFGRIMWPIKAIEVEFPQSLDLYKWFARFLLEGQVYQCLEKYKNVLLASPKTMLKSWAK
jgi:ATP-dependent RNA helicase DHX37/DHR1